MRILLVLAFALVGSFASALTTATSSSVYTPIESGCFAWIYVDPVTNDTMELGLVYMWPTTLDNYNFVMPPYRGSLINGGEPGSGEILGGVHGGPYGDIGDWEEVETGNPDIPRVIKLTIGNTCSTLEPTGDPGC